MTDDPRTENRVSTHVRWGLFGALAAGLASAGALAVHVLFLVPEALTRCDGPFGALLRMLGASTLSAAILMLPVVLLALAVRLVRGSPVSTVYRGAAMAIPVAGVALAWVQFRWFEGRVDGGSIVALLAALSAALSLVTVVSRFVVRRRPSARAPSWWWSVGAVLAVAVLAVPPAEVRWPSFDSPATPDRGVPSPTPDAREPARFPAAATVVLITVDTLRADHMGLYGYARDTTPALDRLGGQGFVIERLVAASSCTVPSTATILSGAEPWCSGVVNQFEPVRSGVVTVAERLRDAGYRTVAVVANSLLREVTGFAQGFDEFENLVGSVPGYPPAEAVAERALDLVGATGDPVFAWLHFMDPHYPYLPPEELFRDFLDDALYQSRPLPVIRFGSRGGVRMDRTRAGGPRGGTVDGGRLIARYDGEIRRLDAGIEILLGGLDDLGRLDGAALAFTADHGEALTEHGQLFDHCQEVFDTTTRVPGIFWRPSVLAPARSDSPAAHLDVLPTLLAVAGVGGAAADGLRGIDLTAASDGTEARPLYTQTGLWDGLATVLVGRDGLLPTRAVELDGWKFVLSPHHELARVRGPSTLLHAWRATLSGIWQPDALYDVAADPGERANRIGAEPARAARLRALIQDYPAEPDLASCPLDRSAGEELSPETRRELEERLRSLGYIH